MNNMNVSSNFQRNLLDEPVYAVSTRDYDGNHHYSTQPMFRVGDGSTYVILRDITFMRDISIGYPVKVFLTHHINARTFNINPDVNHHICEFEFSITNKEIEKMSSNAHVILTRSTVVNNIYTLEMTLSQYENQTNNNDKKMTYSIAFPALTITN